MPDDRKDPYGKSGVTVEENIRPAVCLLDILREEVETVSGKGDDIEVGQSRWMYLIVDFESEG